MNVCYVPYLSDFAAIAPGITLWEGAALTQSLKFIMMPNSVRLLIFPLVM